MKNEDDPHTPRKTQGAKSKRTVRNDALGEKKGKGGNAAGVLVRVTSRRTRLIDPDNLTPKYFIDCCRYCGWIADDSASHVRVETSQEKVCKEDEETIIEIIQL